MVVFVVDGVCVGRVMICLLELVGLLLVDIDYVNVYGMVMFIGDVVEVNVICVVGCD